MKIRYLLALVCLLATSAQAEDMVVYTWDPGCNHTVATNWFTLSAQQESAKIVVDLSECDDEQIGSLIFFGNYATKTSGRQLTSRHKIQLSFAALDRYGNIVAQDRSDDGSILVDAANLGSRQYWFLAKNTNRNKGVTIRLRAQLLRP